MSDACRRPSPANPLLLSLKVCAAGLTLGVAIGASAQQQQAAPASPPPGMVTGAYGQSSLQQAAVTQPPAVSTAPAAPLPAATATDPVSRFLQERGLLVQAQGGSSKLLNQVRDTASDLVLSAMNFLGVRYKLGGNSMENGFDCSGFTRHIFEMSVGLVLPRRADEQAKLSSLIPIKQDELKPGDLVFFNTMRRTFSHVGIYVGEGKFIHAPRTGSAIRVEDIREAYWAKRFTGARRAADVKSSSAADIGEGRSGVTLTR